MLETSYPYLPLESREAVLTTLLQALEVNDGIIKLTADDGMGKTSVCRELARRLGNEKRGALFFGNVPGNPQELQDIITWALELDKEKNFTRALSDALRQTPAQRMVLIFDDAEKIPDDTYLAIRMLTNIKSPQDSMLVQIVLSGRSELNKRLEMPECRGLLEGITHNIQLPSLNKEESEQFFIHMLNTLQPAERIITPPGIREVFRVTQGKPEQIAAFCHRLLDEGKKGEEDALPGAINEEHIQQLTGTGSTAQPDSGQQTAGRTGIPLLSWISRVTIEPVTRWLVRWSYPVLVAATISSLLLFWTLISQR